MKLVLHNGNALRDESGATVRLVTRKALLLLAILAQHAGEPLSRRTVAETVWPNVDDRAARDSLRTALTSVRRALPEGAVVTELDRVLLRSGAVDIETSFLDGEFMPDFDDDWVVERRLEDRAKAVAHLLTEADLRADQGGFELALGFAERACARDPFSDGAAKRRIEILELLGKRSEAVETSQVHRRRVLRDLGAVSEVSVARVERQSPLWATAEWLLERDPNEALAFLRSTGGHWEVAPAGESLNLHERTLKVADARDRHWKPVRAQMLYIRWCLNGIADNLLPVEEAHLTAREDQDAETAFKLTVVLAYCYLSTGQFERALACATDLPKVAKASKNSDCLATAVQTLSIVHFHAGDAKLARRLMRDIGQQAEDTSSPVVAGQRYLIAAQACLEDGDQQGCDERVQRAKGLFTASAGDRMLGFTGIQEAELLAASGDPLRARQELARVLARGADVIGHSAMAMASDLLASVECRLGEFDLSAESLAVSSAFRQALGTVASPKERRRLAPVKKQLIERLGPDYLRRVIGRPRLAVS